MSKSCHCKNYSKRFPFKVAVFRFCRCQVSRFVDNQVIILGYYSTNGFSDAFVVRVTSLSKEYGCTNGSLISSSTSDWNALRHSSDERFIGSLERFIFLPEFIDTLRLGRIVWNLSPKVVDESDESFNFFDILRWLQLKEFLNVLLFWL